MIYPNFVNTIFKACVSIATANTNRDGTGTIGTVKTAGTNGSRIDSIRIQASVATTAGVIRLFIYDGSTYYLLKEVLVDAITPSVSIEAFSADLSYPDGLFLPAGYSLRASTHIAETFKVIAQGGDF